MYLTVRAEVLDVIKKDYDIDGRKGTSNKLQLIVRQPEKASVHTIKYDPQKVTFDIGEVADFTIEVKESQRGISLELVSATD